MDARGGAHGRSIVGRRTIVLLAAAGAVVLVVLAARMLDVGTGATIHYLSPSGSDGGPCTAAAPCRSLDRAYDLAAPGDTVELAAGDYPGDQTIDGQKASPGVLFRPAPGATATLATVTIEASNLELRDLKLESWDARLPSNNFTARNLDVDWFETHGANNTTVLGGDIGPSYNPGGSSANIRIGYAENTDGIDQPTRNLTIDGATIHDFRRGTPADHMECLFVIGVDGLELRNSTFLRCDIYSIFFTHAWWTNPGIITNTNILLENNVFDESTNHGQYGDTYDSVRFSDWMPRFDNITVRHNSFKQDFSFGDNPKNNIHVYGNIAPRGWCSNGPINYHHNVWQWHENEPCGPTDTIVIGTQWGLEQLGYTNPTTLNLQPTPTSPAIDAGDPNNYPARDLDGRSRPIGPRPDAGAFERG